MSHFFMHYHSGFSPPFVKREKFFLISLGGTKSGGNWLFIPFLVGEKNMLAAMITWKVIISWKKNCNADFKTFDWKCIALVFFSLNSLMWCQESIALLFLNWNMLFMTSQLLVLSYHRTNKKCFLNGGVQHSITSEKICLTDLGFILGCMK